MDYTWDTLLLAGLKALMTAGIIAMAAMVVGCGQTAQIEPQTAQGQINAKSCVSHQGASPKWLIEIVGSVEAVNATDLMDCQSIDQVGVNCGTGYYKSQFVFGCLESE